MLTGKPSSVFTAFVVARFSFVVFCFSFVGFVDFVDFISHVMAAVSSQSVTRQELRAATSINRSKTPAFLSTSAG